MRRERTWVEISRSALRQNVAAMQRVVGSSVQVMPIVKANAYGHGLPETLQALNGVPLWGVGVAYGHEALAARQLGYGGRILVLSYWSSDELSELIRNNIEVVCWDWSSWSAILSAHRRHRAKIHLKLDTGTSRIGFLPGDLQRLRREIRRYPDIHITGLFSHLANSEETAPTRTRNQVKYFTTLDRELGLDKGIVRHLACTAASIRYPEARFGLVRPGIGVYGLWPSVTIQRFSKAHKPQINLHPVLTWKSRLSQIKTLPAGTGIGYGSTVKVKKAMRLGIIPVGYSDGYARAWSNRAWVMIRGRKAPVIGRVCMNLLMVDLSAIPRATLRDEVTLLGPGILADDLAELDHTLNYEVVSRIARTVPRILA